MQNRLLAVNVLEEMRLEREREAQRKAERIAPAARGEEIVTV